jgi:flagellar biosynthesis protein FlhA
LRTTWLQHRGLIFPVLIAVSVLVLIVPLPPVVLDLLLSANITLAVVILLTTISVGRPLDFSVFPTLLLGTTLARLVLNVASTRLILTRGAEDGTAAAGGVIQAFGEFVAGGQIAVGLIMFLILVTIQFLVITKGATRISEVAARFALDGMPGKQMAIDADLNAGFITPEQARQRRAEVSQQADFYGAMDGASKFVRGDAVAGLVITLVNIAGGMYIGVVEHGMPLWEAVQVFTRLTIGDGLVAQVPAFLIALAAGLLVTRSSTSQNLSDDMIGQVFVHPQALLVAAVFLGGLSLTGLPKVPLLVLGAGLCLVAVSLSRRQKQQQLAAAEAPPPAPVRAAPRPEDHLLVDPMELELGFGLIRLADAGSGGDLLDRVTRVRHAIARELGMILPKVRIRDNVRLGQRQYQLRLQGVPVAGGEVFPDGLLAIETSDVLGRIAGIPASDPATGQSAVWIEASQRGRADVFGYRIVEPAGVIAAHLTEVVRQHSSELLSRQQVHQLLDNLKQTSPTVVEELIPQVLKTSQVHQVLSNLLRERVCIRNLETILETLGDHADQTVDLAVLTEHVRRSLSRSICQQYRDDQRVLHAVMLDPAVEELLTENVEAGRGHRLPPQIRESLIRATARQVDRLSAAGHPPVVLCSPPVRLAFRELTADRLPALAVLSLNEITRETQVALAGQVGTDVLESQPLASVA